MKKPDHSPLQPSEPLDPERLLRAGLRATTPEFEARFDDLRRRLAQEPAHRRNWLLDSLHLLGRHPASAFAAAAVAALVIVSVVVNPAPSARGLAAEQMEAFGAIVELDDALQGALPLTDRELLEAILLMPVETTKG